MTVSGFDPAGRVLGLEGGAPPGERVLAVAFALQTGICNWPVLRGVFGGGIPAGAGGFHLGSMAGLAAAVGCNDSRKLECQNSQRGSP